VLQVRYGRSTFIFASFDMKPYQVSTSSQGASKRTPDECRIRWLGDRHPAFNHKPWTAEEAKQLKELMDNTAQDQEDIADWVDVASKLGV
jgi:hypothetical protein